MPGTKKNTPAGPAQWVGGQRRKLVRRNRSTTGPPRPNSMSLLTPGSTAASFVNTISNAVLSYTKEEQSGGSLEEQQSNISEGSAPLKGKMPSHPHSTASKINTPHIPSSDYSVHTPPKLLITNSKRKQGLFGNKKPRALDRPPPQVVTSPLPVSTPSKAAKFFGLDTSPTFTGSPGHIRSQNDDLRDDGQDALSDTLAFEQHHPLSLLTKSQLGSEKDTWLDGDGDLEPQESQSTNTGETVATRGLRMLIPRFTGPSPPQIEQATSSPASPSSCGRKRNASLGQSTNVSRVPRFRIPAAPLSVPPVPKRNRMRRRGPKSLERMSPITEASSESLRPAHCNSDTATALDVISEHDIDDVRRSVPVLPSSHSEMMLKPDCELNDMDSSSTDEFYDEDVSPSEAEDEKFVHPGTKVDLKRARLQNGNVLYLRSPLQTVEDAYLDATEEDMRLEARRMMLARVEAERQAMDAEIEALRRKHEQLKLRFGVCETSTIDDRQPEPADYELSESTFGALESLNGSINSDEEPTVQEADVKLYMRLLPGAANLVDVPPRKKGPLLCMGSQMSVSNGLTLVEGKHLENAPPGSPLITDQSHKDPDFVTKLSNSDLTRNKSRSMVQDWTSDCNSTEQRPISTRIVPGILADQKTSSKPFLKSEESMPTSLIAVKKRPDPSMSALPEKHQCINDGHIFHPINLRTIPDHAVVNILEVRPYLQTHTGIKQHVKISVLCEKCSQDCNERLWECEIAVCRMTVCQGCAEDMETEWQERAVSGWKYR